MPVSSRPAVSWLADAESLDPGRVGGKAANLAALLRAGLPVPGGFVVCTTAYLDFVEQHGLDVLIGEEVTCLAETAWAAQAVEAASQRLRDAFAESAMPDAVRAEITAAYRTLAAEKVAVRSSATAEDLPGASFAGQQDTLTDVAGADDVCDAVLTCWSSLWTARAMTYRNRNGIAHDRVAMAVVVQPMVASEVAGVLFTADPVTGRRDRVVVEAAAGFGEAVVSGRVTPERWVLDRCTRDVLIAPSLPVLDRDQLSVLVALGIRAAELFGVPQDVEWAVAGGRCWLLQSRPITSLFPLPPPTAPGPRIYLPALLAAQGIAEPFTPAGTVFFQDLIAGWITYLTTGSIEIGTKPPRWLPTLAGRTYIDITPLLRYPRIAARLIANLALKDPTGSAALRDWLTANADRLPTAGRMPIPLAMARWVPGVAAGLVTAVMLPARTRRRVLAAADQRIHDLEQDAAAVSSGRAQLDFLMRGVARRTCELVVAELPIAYAEQVVRLLAERLVTAWLGDAAALDPLRRWLPHDPTMAMGAELARIARTEGEEVMPASPQVKAFLVDYGHRAPDREIDVGLPRFADDPGYVVGMIRAYARAGAQVLQRFDTGAAAAAAAADRLVTEVRRTRGRLRAMILRAVLDRHRELGGMRERPKFDMVRAIALARRMLQQIGESLAVAGELDDPADVFFVDQDLLRAALGGDACDLRASAASGRHEFQRELARRAIPRVLVSDGDTVYGPAADGEDNAEVLTGVPISPGVHEGVARVLDSPVGAELADGEVLVAASTDPGWTPLFLLAGAVVMEVGGAISHGAVVAREYGVPAVAAVARATTRLHTGQRVRVDGGNGTVRVLADSTDHHHHGGDRV